MVLKMDEETLVARANEEREKIFERYDRGREPGNHIDPWEDPQFSVYDKTDRYYFLSQATKPVTFIRCFFLKVRLHPRYTIVTK
jgi:hypothetical protein